MMEQRRIASCVILFNDTFCCVGSYCLHYHLYKKYGQQCWRNISCAHETGNVLDRYVVWVGRHKDNNIVDYLPTESIQGLFPFRKCSGSISHKIARTSQPYCCSAKQESVQHLQQWPHGYRIKNVMSTIFGRIKNLASTKFLLDLIFAIRLIRKN